MTRHGAVASFASGVIFAVGLAIAGMTDPAKVRAFLDVGGDWDPSLALVMGGAIAVYLPLNRRVLARAHPVLARMFSMPIELHVDWRLLVGSALFGIGWGMVGLCPGPAITSLATGRSPTLLFGAAMAAGMVLFHLVAPVLDRLRRE